MKNERLENIKIAVIHIYLKETGTKKDLIVWFLITGFVVGILSGCIYRMEREVPQNNAKSEIVGYFDSVEYTKKSLLIKLTNNEVYTINGYMYYSLHPFNKDEFINEVKQGDELHLIIWQGDIDTFPHIYQLECNNKMYLSYESAVANIRIQHIRILGIGIIVVFICGSFAIVALFRYMKLRYGRR